MRIVIAAPLYPPEIGGPAQYAFNLEQSFAALGHKVRVARFAAVRRYPSGLRHLIYFFKIFPALRAADWCLALDTFSVGLPAVLAGRLLGKPVIIRIGGDFLWEQYVERTGDLILLRNFYQTGRSHWNLKEKLIFQLTKWLLRHTAVVVFSTEWQRAIWRIPYQLDSITTGIVENYYATPELAVAPKQKIFIWAGRSLRLKNYPLLANAFKQVRYHHPEVILQSDYLPAAVLRDRLKHCYAVVLPSLSEVSPNLILEAIRFGKPFILTGETGLQDRLKEVSLFINPLNEASLVEKILFLLDEKNYSEFQRRITQFSFRHSWSDMAHEFLSLVAKKQNYL